MQRYLNLYGTKSRCCGARNVIVLSREGGFVSQNCEVCGRPSYLRLKHVPALRCQECGALMEPFRNRRYNYAYSCEECGYEVELADLVPPWHEFGPRYGLWIKSDSWSHRRYRRYRQYGWRYNDDDDDAA